LAIVIHTAAASAALRALDTAIPLGRASAAAVGVVRFVDLAVAVIVLGVTRLGGRAELTEACQAPGDAPDLTRTARPERDAASRAQLGERLVDAPVTVVVGAVAGLVRSADRADARELPCLTDRAARGALRALPAGLSRVLGRVVDEPVAVVVEPVAALRAWRALAVTDPCAAETGAHAWATSARAGAADLACGGQRFIDAPITVIVEVVALLFGFDAGVLSWRTEIPRRIGDIRVEHRRWRRRVRARVPMESAGVEGLAQRTDAARGQRRAIVAGGESERDDRSEHAAQGETTVHGAH
jgi:hypothetical protein